MGTAASWWVAAATACALWWAMMGALGRLPWLDITLHAQADGSAKVVASGMAELSPHVGRQLLSLAAAQPGASAARTGIGTGTAVDAQSLHPAPRWQPDATARADQQAQRVALHTQLQAAQVRVQFADGQTAEARPSARGWAGVGLLPAILLALAAAVWVGAVCLVFWRLDRRNLLLALMLVAQATSVAIAALGAMPGLGLSWPSVPQLALSGSLWEARAGFSLRTSLDMIASAAVLHAAAIHPIRRPGVGTWVLVGWGVSLAGTAAVWLWPHAPGAWLGVHVLCLLLGVAAWVWAHLSYRAVAHPFSRVVQHFLASIIGCWAFAGLAVWATQRHPMLGPAGAGVLDVLMPLWLLGAVLQVPFLARPNVWVSWWSRLSTLGVVVFAFSLMLAALARWDLWALLATALLLALALQGALLLRTRGSAGTTLDLTAEHAFDEVYRVATALRRSPEQANEHAKLLLKHLFKPLEWSTVDHRVPHSRPLGSGASLIVPVDLAAPAAAADPHAPFTDTQEAMGSSGYSLILRYADQGRHLFTRDDARLADHAVAQLRRALAYDWAVEHGRQQERQRIAQDLHDDIGARLLTLMYQAPTPGMEEYIRHTLKDLKTLTQGLQSDGHSLMTAVAEWRSDAELRLDAAGLQLQWDSQLEMEVPLTGVQWSALTRVLRELLSNVLAHSGASHALVRIEVRRVGTAARFQLVVNDNGQGQAPHSWPLGLGIGGIRKRIKQLGGSVVWEDNDPHGIRCTLIVDDLEAERQV